MGFTGFNLVKLGFTELKRVFFFISKRVLLDGIEYFSLQIMFSLFLTVIHGRILNFIGFLPSFT